MIQNPTAFIPRSIDNEPLKTWYSGSHGSTRLKAYAALLPAYHIFSSLSIAFAA